MQVTKRPSRAGDLDAVANTLLGRASRLTRLLMRTGPRELSRTEVGLLTTLTEGSRSIGELAETESLAQPSVSKVVDKLEARGLVVRQRALADGRRVVVSISADGEVFLRRTVDHVRSMLRTALTELSDDDLAVLLSAGEVLDRLAGELGTDGARA
jgi:DNA-binding MarR family transcriptional regulator